MIEQPPPVFLVGQRVRVILKERNRTARIGIVQRVIWHFKDRRYNYYVAVNGKKVSKRYFDEDLEQVSSEQ